MPPANGERATSNVKERKKTTKINEQHTAYYCSQISGDSLRELIDRLIIASSSRSFDQFHLIGLTVDWYWLYV